MAVLLAVASALAYGTGDFFGGLASKRTSAVAVTLLAHGTGLVLSLALGFGTLAFAGIGPTWTDSAWGALGGACAAGAIVVFYEALAGGAMSVVAPITGVVSAVVPFLVAIALGERPGALGIAGAVVALPAIALIGREDPEARMPPGIIGKAVLAGLGFGLTFVFLGHVSGDTGLWPLVASRMCSLLLLGVVMVAVPARRARPGTMPYRLALAAGAGDVAANGLFLLAASRGLLSLVSVIAAMYPASTVGLARVVLQERLRGWQLGGLAMAAVAAIVIGLAGA